MKKPSKKNAVLFFTLGALVFLIFLLGGIYLNVSSPALAKFLGGLIIPVAIVATLAAHVFPWKTKEMSDRFFFSTKSISFMEGISCLFLFTIIVFSAVMIFASLSYHFNP